MANGKLKSLVLLPGKETMVYQVPGGPTKTSIDIRRASGTASKLNINVLNGALGKATVSVAITSKKSPGEEDYIERNLVLGQGGVLERTDENVDPGDSIFIKSDIAGTVVRISSDSIGL